jgi:hypothetical protein
MKDKSSIINKIVEHAADIMEAKMEFNKLVSDQYKEKVIITAHDKIISDRLDAQNSRIQLAIDVMRDNAGCWN